MTGGEDVIKDVNGNKVTQLNHPFLEPNDK